MKKYTYLNEDLVEVVTEPAVAKVGDIIYRPVVWPETLTAARYMEDAAPKKDGKFVAACTAWGGRKDGYAVYKEGEERPILFTESFSRSAFQRCVEAVNWMK